MEKIIEDLKDCKKKLLISISKKPLKRSVEDRKYLKQAEDCHTCGKSHRERHRNKRLLPSYRKM